MQEFYTSGEFRKHNPTYNEEDSSWKSEAIYRILDQNKIKPSLIYDIGCATGGIISNLSEQLTKDVVFKGYDIDPIAIELARAKISSHNVEFHCGNFFEQTKEKADLILLIDVFEHVEDYHSFLRSLNEKANYYIFHIPLDMNIYDLLQDKQINRRNKLGHLHYFSKSTALRTLQDTGYEVIDWFYTRRPQSMVREHQPFPTKIRHSLANILFPKYPDLTVKLLGLYEMIVLAK